MHSPSLRKLLLAAVLFSPSLLWAQNVAPFADTTISASGRPIGGASVAICSNPGLATTAASLSANLVTLTMSSNPITAGFAANQSIAVSGFSGADTYLNGGRVSNTGITNGFTILSVTSTQITYQLSHANASATSNGSVFQAGSTSQTCAPLASISSDPAGASPITQPGFSSDGLGNYQLYAASGTYYAQFYGAILGLRLKPVWVAPSTSTTNTWTANQAFNNLTTSQANSRVICDGRAYITVQAAAAALPATGGEVEVPSASTCTWNGAGFTGSVTIRFMSAVARYSLGSGNAITMTGGNNHLICQAGQPNGLSNQNLPMGAQASGVILNLTGLTSTQDAILITGNNNNDGNTVEGCYIRMNSTGRAGVHICGNGNKVLNNIFHLAGVNGVWVEGCSATGAHSYENRIQGNDIIHAGGDGILLSVDPAGTGVGGDVDGVVLDHNDYHPRDTTGGTSTGQGCRLLVPSTANLSLQTIHHIFFTKFLSNGSANGTYACKLEMDVAGATVAGISDIMFTNGELEDVYQANTGTALLVSTTTPRGVQHIWYRGGIGDGFAAAHNLTGASLNAMGFYLESGSADVTSNTSNPNMFDVISFVNNFSATPSCSGTNISPGIRFGTTQPVSSLVYTNDNIIHLYRCDTATDQWKIDVGNTRFLPSTNGTWRWGDHTTSSLAEVAANNFFTASAPTAVTGWAVFGYDSGNARGALNNNNGTTFDIAQLVASGTATMTTAAITAGNCGTTVTVPASGVATTDTITWAFNAAPAGSNAGLVAWPTANNVNFAYCPDSAETPAAATINWRVIR